MAKAKTKITMKEIKEQIILPALAETSFRYRVLTSTGTYEKAYRANNLRVGTITALIQTTESDIMILGGGVNAVALNASIRFLVPVDDINDVEGAFPIIERFREELTEHLTINGKLTLTLDNKTFIGAVSTSFPVGGELDIRPRFGNSFEFVVYMEIAYVQNAINSSDIQFYLYDDVNDDVNPIPYTQYSITRKNTLTGNLYSNSAIGQSTTYAESSTFGVDLSMPALSTGTAAKLVNEYIMGDSGANKAFDLKIVRGGNTATAKVQKVIFGEVVESGQGTENVTWQISFVPYLEAEDEG